MMLEPGPIINKVAQSEIIVYDLGALFDGRPVAELDLAPFLYKGVVVREKEFREQIRAYDWAQYEGAHVAVFCSADAIVPTWAFMLVATRLENLAASVTLGRTDDALRAYYVRALEREDWSRFTDRPVVIKGCAVKHVPTDAYVQATRKLQAVARKLMYGEPCSAVPLWRRP